MQANFKRGIQMSPRRVDPKFKKQQSGGNIPTWVIAVGIGILVVVGVVVLFTLQRTPAVAPVTDLKVSGIAKGDANAPITIIEVGDFQ
jgi:hypothetical protein